MAVVDLDAQLATAQDRVDADAAVETGRRDDGRVARAPGRVETPLAAGRQLGQHLTARLLALRVPDQHAVVLAAAQQQIRILRHQDVSSVATSRYTLPFKPFSKGFLYGSMEP